MKKRKSEIKLLLTLRKTAIRTSQKEQGMFDGRFVTRVEQSQKVYSRKKKHAGRNDV
jgi:hypothetical protein